MAYNPIQCQQGMSLPEFLQRFGTEAASTEAVRRARWPGGFVCPRCSSGAHCIVVSGRRRLYQCHACHRQTSLTTSSLLGSTKLPLTRWFLAIYFISQAKTGLSALELKRLVGVSYPTAWLMHHKIMTAMAAREDQHRLSGTVQVDDAYLGGERAGGKRGRGSQNKVPFVAAVSLNDAGNPLYVKVNPVPRYTSDAISKWARANLAQGADVLSDGLACFAAVTDAGCTHRAEVVGQRKPQDLPQFKWVNTVLGNLKTMVSGAYKSFAYRKYADRYLGAFAYRFNCRFDLADLVVRLVMDVCLGKAAPERIIREA
jgi:transposase-like protein